MIAFPQLIFKLDLCKFHQHVLIFKISGFENIVYKHQPLWRAPNESTQQSGHPNPHTLAQPTPAPHHPQPPTPHSPHPPMIPHPSSETQERTLSLEIWESDF